MNTTFTNTSQCDRLLVSALFQTDYIWLLPIAQVPDKNTHVLQKLLRFLKAWIYSNNTTRHCTCRIQKNWILWCKPCKILYYFFFGEKYFSCTLKTAVGINYCCSHTNAIGKRAEKIMKMEKTVRFSTSWTINSKKVLFKPNCYKV